MLYTDNNISFVDYAQGTDFPDATAMLGCGTNVELPVTQIEYSYTEGAASLRGDVNMDGTININDVTVLIDYLLGSEVEPFDVEAANCNLDESVGIADVTALIDYLLTGGW